MRPGHLCQVSVHPPSRKPLRGIPQLRSPVASPGPSRAAPGCTTPHPQQRPLGGMVLSTEFPPVIHSASPQRRAHTPNLSSAAHVSSTDIYCSCQSLEIKRYDPEEYRTMRNGPRTNQGGTGTMLTLDGGLWLCYHD